MRRAARCWAIWLSVVPLMAVGQEAPVPEEAAAEAEAEAPGAWARLTEDAGLKVGGFFLAVSGVRIASTRDRAVDTWVQQTDPLGEASVLGARSPPYILGGTAAAIVGLALFEDDPAARARWWRHLEIFAVTQAVNAGLTDLIKVISNRPRPDAGNRLSFPSGHTSSSFAWATFVWRRYGWQWGLPAFAVATFVGMTRIDDRRHWLSDVLAGALLGVSVTYVIDEIYGP